MERKERNDIRPAAGLRAHWTIGGTAAVVTAGLAVALLLLAWPAGDPEDGIRLPVLLGPIPEYETLFSTVLHVDVAWAAEQCSRPRPQRDPGACVYRERDGIRSLEELDALLLQHARREVDGLGTSRAVVTIDCDEDLATGAALPVLESCRRATIWKVWLRGREADSTSPSGWRTRFHPMPLRPQPPGAGRDRSAGPAALVMHLAPGRPLDGGVSIHVGAVAVADLAELAEAISRALSGCEPRGEGLAIRIEGGVRWGDAVQALCVAWRAVEPGQTLFLEVSQ